MAFSLVQIDSKHLRKIVVPTVIAGGVYLLSDGDDVLGTAFLLAALFYFFWL